MDPGALVHEAGFQDLKAFVIEKSGLVYFRDKDVDFAQRVQRRLSARNAPTPRAYLEILRHGVEGPAEFDRLAIELTIGETYFFRHQEQFDALRSTIIPDIIRRNQDSRRLRVWCAGCSIGAEPYSVAILLADEFATALSGWDVRVVGTDLNRDFLTRAVEGRFDDWAFRLTTPELRARHFEKVEKSWVIDPAIRRQVEFRYHNLMHVPYPTLLAGGGSFDLIICRNVMIYFDWDTVARLMPHFEDALGDGGWMVIGHAEQAHGAKRLRLVQMPAVTVYQKAAPVAWPAVRAVPPIDAPANDSAPAVPARSAEPKPARAVNLDAEIVYLKRLADHGEFEEALNVCTRLSALNAEDPRPHFYRGLLCEQVRRPTEVDQSFERAIALDDRFVMAHYYLGLNRRRRQDERGAGRSFRRALSLLESLPGETVVPEADALTVAELRALIGRYLEAA